MWFRQRKNKQYVSSLPVLVGVVALGLMLMAAQPVFSQTGGTVPGIVVGPYVVFGYNDLGMHCMNQDFSELMVLPPYNNLHAQVIRRGEEPRITTSGVTVKYSIPGNTYSAGKVNFWTYVKQLLGLSLAPNVGLTGNKLSGVMAATGDNDWAATGIPLTPVDDKGKNNAYQLGLISVMQNGKLVAQTKPVVPVSWEMNCNLCHTTPGISVATSILRSHDRLHKTTLEKHKPVLCGACHSDNALGTPGVAGVPSLSQSMHTAHASRMSRAKLSVSCYACHPGVQTQCLRDVHYSHGMTCTSCHGTMADVGSPSRKPWIDEPKCYDCHSESGHTYEQSGKLFKQSKGHHGVHCEACHGSPHAITPSVKPADNVQAIGIQGHAGTIDTCSVCHINRPDDNFDHRYSGGTSGTGGGGGTGGSGGGGGESGDD